MRRVLRIDVCDYKNVALCNMYDSLTNVSGGAVDVFITKERNGWKEVSFKIPSVCESGEGLEENYRLAYLVSEYRLRTVETRNGVSETDWYIISENSVNHEAGAKDVEVTCGHISQTLKTKQMNLEFSFDEGNNGGTCEDLLATILDGTNWHVGKVAKFFEDNGVDIKYRSLVEPAGSNAFKMITDLCELFDAKPTFNGDYTVDIGPINPFSVELIPIDDGYGYGKKIHLEDGQIPGLIGDNVVEIHYDKEAKGITRTLNTENLVTRLYAYGAYGDYATGICDLKEINHDEYIYTLPKSSANKECCITIDRGAKRYFKVDENLSKNCSLIFSTLDYASRSYVWNDTTKRAYVLYETKQSSGSVSTYNSSEVRSVQNNVDCLLNFNYYLEVGLLTDEMIQEIAQYQRELPALNAQAVEASTNFSEQLLSLSNIGQDNTGFLKLKVKRYSNDNGSLRIEIDTTENDGIIYRSDYNEKYFFSWHTAKNLKENGDPTSGSPSMIWILHKTNPITFEQAYLKKIDERTKQETDYYGISKTQYADYTYGISEGRPEKITLWANYSDISGRLNAATDDVYLFCTNGATGSLGAAFSSDEAALLSLETELKEGTLKHPVYFEDIRVGNSTKSTPSSSLDYITGNASGYGWAYLYNPNDVVQNGTVSAAPRGKLFFCYHKGGDLQWWPAYCGDTEPSASTYHYFLHTKKSMLYRSNGSKWTLLDPTTSAEYKRIAQAFSVAWKYCLRRDEIYKGKNEHYIWTNTGNTLTLGNYAFMNPYGFYWIFTTDTSVVKNRSLRLQVASNNVFQNEDTASIIDANGNYIGDTNSIVETRAVQNEAIEFPTDNIITPAVFKVGIINTATGVDENEIGDGHVRTISLQINDNTTYETYLPAGSYCVIYDLNNNYMSSANLGGSKTVAMPNQAGYLRIVCPKSVLSGNSFSGNYYVRVQDYTNTLFVNNIRYRILSPIVGQGTNKGINNLIKLYPTYADTAYQTYLPALLDAQEAIKDREQQFADIMQDTVRDARWQETKYVDGDEEKLYSDALDNYFEIGKPEATYEVDFLSIYETQGLTEDDDIPYSDVDIFDAAHLVDPEIDINLWAYLDKVKKCYDQDWKTSIEINTQLSTIAQHSFTDIMSYVADVAKQAKNKQSIYDRAAALSANGKMLAEKLEGTIKANIALISGASANWYTNEKGQMIFENENGLYAMMLTGAGLMIADSKTPEGEWNWRTTMTGAGMTADSIVFGEMSGMRIQAHTITADKVVASLGSELDIGSNAALTLYATKDGYRPAGSLDTQNSIVPKVASDESYIQILPAGKDSRGNAIPARLYLMTGGLLHMEGGKVELISGSTMDLNSSSTMNIKAGGSLNIDVSGGTNSGKFTVNSDNFIIDNKGNVTIKGTVTAYAGNIAGFTIKNKTDNGKLVGTAMYVTGGVDSVTSNVNKGVYLGTDGLNVAGVFVAKADGSNPTIKTAASSIILGGTPLSTTLSNMSSATATAQSTADSKSATWRCTSSQITSKAYKVGDVWQDTASAYGHEYICKSVSNPRSLNDWSLVGTYIVGGAALEIDAVQGNINMVASNTITVAANKSLNLTTKGTVSIGNGGKPFTIGSNGTNAYIYNGKTSSTDTTHAGVYVGTDGIIVGKNLVNGEGGYFQALPDGTVKMTGTITTTGGYIGGWTIGANRLSSGSGTSYVGLDSGTANVDYVIWAGNSSAGSAPFRVTRTGSVTMSSATISGGSITIKDGSTKNFEVTSDGTLTAIKGSVGGWTLGTDYLGSGTSRSGSQVGIGTGTGTTVVFWAGNVNNTAEAPFRVTASGALYTTSGRIGGWYIGSDYIGNASTLATSTVGLYSGTGVTFWAGGTRTGTGDNEAKFKISSDGSLTSTYGTIGSWTISNSGLSKTVTNKGTVTLGTASYAINVNNATDGKDKFTVGYDGYMTSTYGVIGGWTISDEYLYKNVTGKGFVYLGSADYAINVNNKFTVDYTGSTKIKGLNVDGKDIDFSTFESAISISGGWSGSTFTATASLWNRADLTRSLSLNASFTATDGVLEDCNENGIGQATVLVSVTTGGAGSSSYVDCVIPSFDASIARADGYDKGYGSGHADGVIDGYTRGRQDGYKAGYEVGFREGSGSGGGGGGCFIAGSMVTLEDETTIPIEMLTVGTIILAFSELTKSYVRTEILATQMFKHRTNVYDICMANGVTITLTDSHPILTTSGWKAINPIEAMKEHFISVSQLKPDDIVIGPKGNILVNEIIFREDLNDATVYNIDVEPYDTYIVNGIVVHNAEVKPDNP